MKVREPHAAPGQRIQMGGIDFAAKGAQVGKAPVVGHQHHNVGALGRGCHHRACRKGPTAQAQAHKQCASRHQSLCPFIHPQPPLKFSTQECRFAEHHTLLYFFNVARQPNID